MNDSITIKYPTLISITSIIIIGLIGGFGACWWCLFRSRGVGEVMGVTN